MSHSAELTIQKLLTALQRNHDEIEPGLKAKNQRARLIGSLSLIWDFLEHQQVSQDVSGDLLDLITALEDLNSGTIAPFLSAQQTNRAPDSSKIWRIRALVTAAICRLERDGSLQKVLDELEKDFGFMKQIIAPTASKLGSAARRWRRDFKSGACKNSFAQFIFEGFLDTPTNALLKGAIEEALTLADELLDQASARRFKHDANGALAQAKLRT